MSHRMEVENKCGCNFVDYDFRHDAMQATSEENP